MEFILGELLLGWKKDVKLVFLLFALCVAGIFCIGTAGHLLHETDVQVGEYKEIYEDVQFYSILDHFVGDAAAELDKQENSVKFRKFLDLMSESEYFEYFMIYEQPVYIGDYRGEEKNLYGYEQGKSILDSITDIPDGEGNSRKSVPVKTLWLGDHVMDSFGLQLSGGKGFGEDDFVLRPDKRISVILGADYADAYEVGDKLFVSFVFAQGEAEVIGFLREGSSIYYRGGFRSLDNYVIMPIFENDTYEGESVFKINVNHFYTLRNSGVIASKLSAEDVQEIITGYAVEAGFGAVGEVYYVTEYSDVTKNNFDYGIDMVFFLVIVIVVSAIVVICTFTGVCTLYRMKKNRKYFAVLMLNGYSKKAICSMLLLEEIFLFGAAVLTAGGIYVAAVRRIHLDNAVLMDTMLLGGLFFAVLPGVLATVWLFRGDLAYYLKEEAEDAGIKRNNKNI